MDKLHNDKITHKMTEEDYYPNKIKIMLFTEEGTNYWYDSNMVLPSIPYTNHVRFSPFVKLNKYIFLPSNVKTPIPDNYLTPLFNEEKYNDIINKYFKKSKLTITQSCKNNIIDNNIKETLDILFKKGNIITINNKKHKISNYTWNKGDWTIYSDYLDKQLFSGKTEINSDEKLKIKDTSDSFYQINIKTPNCINGSNFKNTLFNKKNVKEEPPLSKEELFSENNIYKIFKDKQNTNIFYKCLCFNLNYNIPLFGKDPLTNSILYISNNFIKETENNSSLKKIFNDLKDNSNNLKSIIDQLYFLYNNLNFGLDDDSSKIKNNFNKMIILYYIISHLLSESSLDFNTYLKNNSNISEKEKVKLLEDIMNNIKSNKSIKIKNISITDPSIDIEKILQTLDTNFRKNQNYNSYKNFPNTSSYNFENVVNKYNNSINKNLHIDKEITELYNDYMSKIITIIKSDNPSVFFNYPSSEDPTEVLNKIKVKINNTNKLLKHNKYDKGVNSIKYCKDFGELIKKKIEIQNIYLKTLFLFYKNLYNYKKKEFQSLSSNLTKSENVRLQIILKIILFDVYIYNKLITNEDYNGLMINIINTIPINLTKINNNTIDKYKNKFIYDNFNLDQLMWKSIKKTTMEIKNKVKKLISESITEYIKLDHFYKDSESNIKLEGIEDLYNLKFSNKKYDEKQNIKILCYELLLLFSRINLITFNRYYEYNIVQKILCKINNKIDDCSIMDCFESYKESIKEITNINVDNICNSLTSQSNTEYRLNFLKQDFLLKKKILKKDDNLIYNGKDLIKTVKDSIKWHYAFRGYTFNFDDFCHDEKEFINGMVLYGFNIYNDMSTTNNYPYIVIQKENIFYCNYYYKENILIFTSPTPSSSSSPTPSSSSPSSSSHVIKGGAVESYDKQYKIGNVLNQFLKKPEKEENNKKKVEQHIRYNQLCYFIPIKLKFSQDEKEKDVQERLIQNCKTTYESLQLAWGKLLNISKDEKKEENKDEKKEENNKEEKKDEKK
jgi:hypothetical protein